MAKGGTMMKKKGMAMGGLKNTSLQDKLDSRSYLPLYVTRWAT